MTQAFRSARWMVLLLLFVACFGSAAVARASAETHEVAISGFMFHPDSLTVRVGDKVVWRNADIVPHTVTAEDKSFASPLIQPGATWTFVAKTAGTFAYHCTPHPNMVGTLIVE